MKYLAFDLGASSGRAVLGVLENGKLELEEVYRFPNGGVEKDNGLHWDLDVLVGHLKSGIKAYVERYGAALDGISVDTWGVDYVLLDSDGRPIALPHHYRDQRVEGLSEEVSRIISDQDLFAASRIQFMPFNTLYQLYADRKSELLDGADSFLMMADYLNYSLCGVPRQDYSLASTSQLLDPGARQWADGLIEKLGLPRGTFPEIVSSCSVLGPVSAELVEATGISADTPVIASASHDTGCAVAATPIAGEDAAYLSSGTWSLLGVELAEPLVNQQVAQANFTNEGGANGTIRFLKNVAGLWLIQGCQKKWGDDYGVIAKEAEAAAPFQALLDPDDDSFLNPEDMEEAIKNYCRDKGQAVPEGKGAVARCVFESLALKYRSVLGTIRELTGRQFSKLHVVGGGSQNEFLCQLTADATGLRVEAGPVEATAIGNLLLQAMAREELASLKELREVVAASFKPVVYEPRDGEWEKASGRFEELNG